jgi:hypothetical protein
VDKLTRPAAAGVIIRERRDLSKYHEERKING